MKGKRLAIGTFEKGSLSILKDYYKKNEKIKVYVRASIIFLLESNSIQKISTKKLKEILRELSLVTENPSIKNIYHFIISNKNLLSIELLEYFMNKIFLAKEKIKWNAYNKRYFNYIILQARKKYSNCCVEKIKEIENYIRNNDRYQKYYYLNYLEGIDNEKDFLKFYREISSKLSKVNSEELYERILSMFEKLVSNYEKNKSYIKLKNTISRKKARNKSKEDIYKVSTKVTLREESDDNELLYLRGESIFYTLDDVKEESEVVPIGNGKQIYRKIKRIPRNYIGKDLKETLKKIYDKLNKRKIKFLGIDILTKEQSAILKNFQSRGTYDDKWYKIGLTRLKKLPISYLSYDYVISLMEYMYEDDIKDLLSMLKDSNI